MSQYGRAPGEGDAEADFNLENLNVGDQSPVMVGGVGACLLFLVAVGGLSLGAVEPLTYGIRYNFFNKFADTETIYEPGRYFVGPFSTFLVFPASVQSIEFTNEPRLMQSGVRYPALHTRTKEGLALHLQVSLQYQLVKEQVGNLYAEFNKGYEDMFISTIRDTLIRAAADYEALQLWEMRKDVGVRMQDMVDKALHRTYARCWGLQLMVIELPQKFDNSIVATQVQNQKVSTERFAQTATQIRATTTVIEAEYAKKVKIIKAQGQANYTVLTKIAGAKARKKVLDTEAEVLGIVSQKLQLVSADLVEYQRFSAVTMMPEATVFYGFGEGTQVLMQSVDAGPAPPTFQDAQPPAPAPARLLDDAVDDVGKDGLTTVHHRSDEL